MMVRSLMVLLTLSLLGLTSRPVSSQDKPPGPKRLGPMRLSTTPVPLQQLVQNADRIFLGEVTDVDVKPTDLPGVKGKTDVRTVTFKIEEVVKGESDKLKKGGIYQVRQLAFASSPVKKGDKLLWYLAPADKTIGLTQPVGVHSGHFLVNDKTKQAMNLHGNKDLIKVERLRQDLPEVLKSLDKDRGEQIKGVLSTWNANTFTRPGTEVPLDLLIARTRDLNK